MTDTSTLDVRDRDEWTVPFPESGPLTIAGPCSAESEEQVMRVAKELNNQNIHVFRSGIWKPRSRPGSFEGIGEEGLRWLRNVKSATDLAVTVEVANADHVEKALDTGVDVLWIGARTTTSPFAVQEIADALRGTDVPVLVKNPINPSVKLWIGALERIRNAGIDQIGTVHRGFSTYETSPNRYDPIWKLPIEIMRRFEDLPILCDPSHICGTTDPLADVAQKALDLEFDGLMVEVHPDPARAKSDAAQQLRPDEFQNLMDQLQVRREDSGDEEFRRKLRKWREEIDLIDEELVELLSRRMDIIRRIGKEKARSDVTILQRDRWSDVFEDRLQEGKAKNLDEEFTRSILEAIHEEAIRIQDRILNRPGEDE